MKKTILFLAVAFATTVSFGQTGTVTSVNLLTGKTGTDVNATVTQSTTNPVITLNVPDASPTARGVITTGNQTFSGLKTFNNGLIINSIIPNTSSSLQVNGDITIPNDYGLMMGGSYIFSDTMNGLTIRSNNINLQGDVDMFSGIIVNENSVNVNILENTTFRISGGSGPGGLGYSLNRMQISPNGNISFDTSDVLGLGHGGTFSVVGNSLFNNKVCIGNGLLANGNFPTTAAGVNLANYNLFVKGGILTEEVRVSLKSAWADYVFAKDYKLPSLQEVETQIKEKGHLANVPSAKEIKEGGIDLGEMAKIQQEKIEELTLYLIQQNKEITALKTLVQNLLNKKQGH